MLRTSPTVVEIDLSALRSNFLELRQKIKPSLSILAVVKSDAYGHKASLVAPVLQEAGVDLFGVGTVDEGIRLREAGIKKPILILMGPLEAGPELLFEYHLTPVVENLEVARSLNKVAEKKGQKLSVHLKVDTGMTRLGVPCREWDSFWNDFKKLNFLQCEGILSHLAEAGDLDYTDFQRKNFQSVLQALAKSGDLPRWRHLANSVEAIEGAGEDRVNHPSNLVRLGLVLYGAYPIPRLKTKISLKPVLSLKTKIISLKKVPTGTSISYNRTFKAGRESLIGVLPLGYADGYTRILSNKASVLVHGKRAPVVGTICMDLCMVDLTEAGTVSVGDEVVVIGQQGSDEIRADELAAWAGTISYEIFCSLSPRLRSVTRINSPK
ncbi:MAG: alanine racemase [Deltaproteobacteria bacterium]|nr:alanine racemase [Deltaproteobacteria bacterium]